jgi:hypothetical protein
MIISFLDTPQIIVVLGCFGFNSHGSRWWFRRRGTYLHGVHPLDPAISFCSAEGPTLFEPLKGILEPINGYIIIILIYQ